MTLTRTLRFALAGALVATPALAGVRAELEPGTQLAVGQSAQLQIVVDGDGAQPPAAPRLDGARVQAVGQMSQTQSINGRATQQTTYLYAVEPTRTGALDIPPIDVTTAAGTERTAPIHATVSASPAPAAAPSAITAAPAASTTPAFLTLDTGGAKSLVVGQALPIKIHAFFRAGTSATLQGPPHLTSDAFTLSGLPDKPAQAQIELHGEPYLEATWTGVVSPVKPTADLLGVDMPVELAYRAAPPPQARPQHTLRDVFGGDPFGGMDPFGSGDPFGGMDPFGGADPFGDVDSMFDIGPMQRRDVTLHAAAGRLAITDVPAAGKPAGFTGAIGAFHLAVDPIGEPPHVGEPIELTVHVIGTGNFDRVALAGVPDAPALQAYPIKAQPGAAPAERTAEKTFVQTLVPAQAGPLTIPALSLAYFDPAHHAYATATTSPIVLAVEPARGGATTALPAAATAATRAPALAASDVRHATLIPRFRRAGFWWWPVALLAATLASIAAASYRRSARFASSRTSRRVARAVGRAAADMHRAADRDDSPAFFAAARAVLQRRLAAAWHVAPEAITATDVAHRLGRDGDAIRAVLERADAIEYARGAAPAEPLAPWCAVVERELAHLEVPS